MLRSLYVRDYALIEELDVSFQPGLNIITGETGAGKSILIGALQMILGERASMEVVRAGAAKSVVEGIFDEADDPSIRDILEANGIEAQPTVILRREITPSFSRGFVNDSPATLQVMREIASHLIDLHGQHEHQQLLDVSTHLHLLDSFADLAGAKREYHEAFRRTDDLVNQRRQLLTRKREMEQQKELFAFQIEEIDRVSPRDGEDEELENERRVLENAERLTAATSDLYALLYDSEGAVHDQLARARSELQDLARIDTSFEEMLSEIDSAAIIISEAAKSLQRYGGRIEFNPERLEEMRVRLADLERLKRKYGGTLESVIAHRKEVGAGYEIARDFEGALARIDEQIREAQSRLSTIAVELSDRRMKAARRVEEAVAEECARLGMPDSKFDVRFATDMDDDGWVTAPDGSRVVAFESGMDRVEFYISTNLGEEPKPLAKIASGGEISRIMLALKTILARTERFPILVFDEIDVGISGATATKVAKSMHELASSHQIIAITHLPQIAVRGDAHFLVEKYVDGARTKTRIRRLDEEHRAHHVAGMMSGEASDAALESARRLIEAAKKTA